MIQLVRTGSPITAAEREAIFANMRDPMRVEDPVRLYDRALSYRRERAFFSVFAEERGPLLRARLAPAERNELVSMVERVANAYGEASELQAGSLVRLRKILSR